MLIEPGQKFRGGFRRKVIGLSAPLRYILHLGIRLALIVFIKAAAGEGLARDAVVDESGRVIALGFEFLGEHRHVGADQGIIRVPEQGNPVP